MQPAVCSASPGRRHAAIAQHFSPSSAVPVPPSQPRALAEGLRLDPSVPPGSCSSLGGYFQIKLVIAGPTDKVFSLPVAVSSGPFGLLH